MFTLPRICTLSLVTCSLVLSSASLSAFTITYNFNDDSTTVKNKSAAITGADAAGITASDMSANIEDSDSGFSSTTDMAFNRASATASSETNAVDGSRFFSFTISKVNASDTFDLSNFSIDIGGTSSAGNYTQFFTAQSSVGGFGSSNPTLTFSPSNHRDILSSNHNDFQLTSSTIGLSPAAGFENLSSVTFRIFFYDSVSNTNQIGRFDNVVVNGTLNSVPEPATYAGIAGLLILGLAFWRRQACR